MMCGICGVARTDNLPVFAEPVNRMNAALSHRGPDGEGYLLKPGIALAMRRLAVIDLETGDQPIANEDETLWTVLNGEIYNFPEIRELLEKRGHKFRTRTDTECLVHLYEDHGPELVQHLRGMFAFAIWDVENQRLLLARDRFGKKPLYYTVQRGSLHFSSELGSLLHSLSEVPSIDLQAIDSYLSLQYIPEPLTPFLGIHKLPQAHRLVWEKGSVRIERYWELKYLPKWIANETDLIDELKERLRHAVRIRLISDVPLGVHLSGGIDSSIIVALMAELADQQVRTFSVGFEEEAFSELHFARQVAERYATRHQEFMVSYADVPASFASLAHHLGEPLADPSILPLYYLARATREHVTVVLNGDGGDESLAGYPRYWLDPLANRYIALPSWVTRNLVPALTSSIREVGNRPAGASLVVGMKRLNQLPTVDPRASMLRWGSYFNPAQKSDLWRAELRSVLNLKRAESYLVELFEAANATSFLDRTLYVDNHSYLPGDLLLKADRMTMASSLEGRSPFLDHEFATWAARLPEHMKVRRNRGKHLLRRAFESELPPSVRKRGKQGFSIPVGLWLRGPLANWTREILLDDSSRTLDWFRREAVTKLLGEHASMSVDHGKRLWALIMLELWSRAIPGRGPA